MAKDAALKESKRKAPPAAPTEERCVVCDCIIPEGRMVCPICEATISSEELLAVPQERIADLCVPAGNQAPTRQLNRAAIHVP